MSADKNRRLSEAYEHMVERAEALFSATDKVKSNLRQTLQQAKNIMVALGELTSEEADDVADHIQDYLHENARHLIEQERDLADYLRLDILLIEKESLNRITRLVDITRQELGHAGSKPAHPRVWHSGEITGIGSLACNSCGKAIHFQRPGHVPPCTQCNGSDFKRIWKI